MRTIIFAVLGLAVLAAALLMAQPLFHSPPPQPVVVHSQGPTQERLEQLSHLVATRVYIADVLVGKGSGCKGAWLVKGDALLAVDLGKAAITEKDEVAKRATIRLPPPAVFQARVDHTRTKTWEVRTTTWIPWSSDQDHLRDAVMREAQELVAHAAASAENFQQTRTITATLIRSFYQEVGWEVAVVWSDMPKEAPKTPSAPP